MCAACNTRSAMVYATQFDEFCWWDNHVPTQLYLVLRDINGRLKGKDE